MLPSASNPSNPCSTVNSASPASRAPPSWAATKLSVCAHGIRPLIANPTDTAGLKWPPEMWPTA